MIMKLPYGKLLRELIYAEVVESKKEQGKEELNINTGMPRSAGVSITFIPKKH